MRNLFIAAVSLFACSVVADAPPAGPVEAPCLLTVRTPVGATLLVNGQRTAQMTEVRKFISPKLQAGKTFYYTFEVFYQENLEIITKKKQIAVKAGDDTAFDFSDVAPTKVPPPKKTDANMFEEPKKN